MSSEIKILKKKESVIDRLFIPATTSQVQRYRKLSHELSVRNLTKLHDLARDRIDSLLNEVESELSKSS